MLKGRAEYILRMFWGRFYILMTSLERPQDTLCCLGLTQCIKYQYNQYN